MNILAHVPHFIPRHNSGGEIFLYEILSSIKGADVVLIEDDAVPRQVDNISVKQYDEQWYRWADVVVTHLGKTGFCLNKTRKIPKPLIHVIHNDYRMRQLDLLKGQHFIYNSEWVKGRLNYSGPGIVWHPKGKIYKNTNPRYVTLINCNDNKGGDIFIEIAKKMPETEFLGVRGSYKFQIENQLPNITYLDNQSDMSWVYDNTKILLSLSYYESFGIAAREAAESGIPILSHPTGGLVENLGDYPVWIDRKFIDSYVEAIKNINKFTFDKKNLSLTKNDNLYEWIRGNCLTPTFGNGQRGQKEKVWQG